MDNTIWLWILAAVLVAAGLVGLVLPFLPGAILIFGGLLLAAWIEDFAYVGFGTLTALGIMAALTFVCDAAGTAFGAKRYGASKRAIAGAAIGSVIGVFFGIVGILLGPFIGAVIGELSTQPNIFAATRAGVGAAIGLAIAVAAKLALAFAMIGVFLIVRFF
jgi:uncharacterized protein